MADPVEQRRAGGISGALSQLAASVTSLVHTRLELVMVEFDEERLRTKDLLVLAVIATVFFAFALIVLTVLIVYLFWDTHPVGALIGVMLVYAAIGVGAVILLRRRMQSPPFAATLAELRRDADALRGRP